MKQQEIDLISKFGSKSVHISNLRIGDTVIYNDSLRTIGKDSLRLSSFMGLSIFGDDSIKRIKRVNLKNQTNCFHKTNSCR